MVLGRGRENSHDQIMPLNIKMSSWPLTALAYFRRSHFIYSFVANSEIMKSAFSFARTGFKGC